MVYYLMVSKPHNKTAFYFVLCGNIIPSLGYQLVSYFRENRITLFSTKTTLRLIDTKIPRLQQILQHRNTVTVHSLQLLHLYTDVKHTEGITFTNLIFIMTSPFINIINLPPLHPPSGITSLLLSTH
uniref:Uncharacterized protein n=1 Tax=Mus musculus TaxID=10090 RepID=Q9D314_MOUSE|nr:unnamed protein product [Mus musculus]